MDDDVLVQTEDWRSTKEAVANFRRLLICSKWACAGSRAGDGCVVCHSPAWVKDIQINRQLSSVIQLFSGLESLLSPVVQQPDSPVAESLTQPESPVCKLKKNFKIWFSPRSRKVRCTVENKPSEVSVPESRSPGQTAAATTTQPDNVSAQSQDLSVFNFTSSSEDSASSSSCSQRGKNQNSNKTKSATRKKAASRKASAATTTRKQSQQKKNRLEAINQQWGITEEADDLQEQLCSAENARRRSSKRVSFLSPSATPEELQPGAPQQCGGNDDLSPDGRTVRESSSGDGATVPNDQTQPGCCVSDCDVERDIVIANEPNLSCDSEKLDHVSPSRRTKREEKVPALETTPKRPRASPGRRRKSQMSPTTLNRLSSPSPGCQDESIKNSGEEQEGSPSITVCMKSPSPRAASVGRPASGSPAYLKRNHKGESPLHLAAIKGDVEAVIELLEQGADPNLKDNAGWTPLHEACNLGHLPVVEVLVSRGALLNTPGYENDSPLHDAVRNGHPAIAKLLLQLGASQNVLNLHGKRPADYAAGLVMLEIFQEASEGTQRANTSLSPSARLSVVKGCGRRDEIVVFLTSKLSKPEQRQLAKLGKLLGGKIADTFSVSVSHVVVPEGQMPTIYSTLLALLSGCWVVKFSWVEACLQAGKWVPESEHEAGEGPQRSRINRCSLLPPLFDGCFFFLLGSFKAPPKEQLTKLLREGGGQLLSRQPKHDSDVTQTLSAAAYHAEPGSDQALCTQYILYDPQGPHKPTVVRRGKVWSAPSTWLIDCITAFRLLPVPLPQTSV